MTKKTQTAIEEYWRGRVASLGYKRGSKTYMNAQAEFFVGAMAAMAAEAESEEDKQRAFLPYWVICIQCGRDILDILDEVKKDKG